MPRGPRLLDRNSDQQTRTGYYVNVARTLNGMTPARLAERLSEETQRTYSEEVIRNIENGRRRVDASEISALSEIFGLPAAWFLEGLMVIPGYEGVTRPFHHTPTDLAFPDVAA